MKRDDAKNVPTYAKKRIKMGLKMAPSGEAIFDQFLIPKPSQNGSKIDPKREKTRSKTDVKINTHF